MILGFGKKSSVEDRLAMQAEAILTHGSAIIRMSETNQQLFSTLVARIAEGESVFSEAINSLRTAVLSIQDRIEELEKVLIEEGKMVKMPSSLKDEEKN